VTVGYRLVGLIDQAQGAPLTQRVKGVRQTLSEQMGLLLPAIGVRDDLAQAHPVQRAAQRHAGGRRRGASDRLMAIPSPQPTASWTACPASTRPTACR
jgi:flagellar biosynthesis protein FlhA